MIFHQFSEVRDFPGGIRGTISHENQRAEVTVAPILTDREDTEWSGAVAMTIDTKSKFPLKVRVGGGFTEWFHLPPNESMLTDQVTENGDDVTEVSPNLYRIWRPGNHDHVVLLRMTGGAANIEQDDNGNHLSIDLPSGSGSFVLAFADSSQRAEELVQHDPYQALAEVGKYYKALHAESYIDTPEEVLNDAFRAALTVNEYCWFEPLGWIEGVHHWVTLWHQQHAGMAHWLGQHDRAASTLKEIARRQYENGRIPHLEPTAARRSDFGGANHFFCWQVLVYLRATGDRETIAGLLPCLRKLLRNTEEEYDPTGRGLPAWGLQVGNQEDFVSTPHTGTSPAMHYMVILRTVALAEEFSGNRKRADELHARALRVANDARRFLYNRELGRFVYMRDHTGMIRPDGQYHTLILPVLEDVLDPWEAWQSLRHLDDRLTGVDGETYLSNNFPDHLPELWATWGMQAGAAQQPWATWAYARAGMTDKVIEPLRAAARWVFNDSQQGTWPETANEVRPAYFSPPAALWVQAVVEALFGLHADVDAGVLELSPSFPDSWPKARLVLPEWRVEYTRNGDFVECHIWSQKPMVRRVSWPFESGRIQNLIVNGASIDHEATPCPNGFRMRFETGVEEETSISFTYIPEPLKVHGPGSIAVGDSAEYTTNAGAVIGAVDPSGIFRSTEMEGGKLAAHLHGDLLDGHLEFGRLGQLNFSRRTFFVRVKTAGGRIVEIPIHITVLPRCEFSAKAKSVMKEAVLLALKIRNNTSEDLSGNVQLESMDANASAAIVLPPRSETEVEIQLEKCRPTIGKNRISVILPGGEHVESFVLLEGDPQQKIQPIPLPEELLKTDLEYTSFRDYYNGHESVWRSPVSPLEDLRGLGTFEIPELSGVPFHARDNRLIPVGCDPGRTSVVIDLPNPRPVRKIYMLVCPFLTNHEMFTQVARVELHHPRPEIGFNEEGRIIARSVTSRTLHFPGDLDWFYPVGTQVALSTWHRKRPDRHGMLPLLSPEEADWPAGISRPPAFPQPDYWCDSAALSTANALFNVVEIAPRHPMVVERVVIHPLGTDSVLGIVAMSVDYMEEEQGKGR